ncbi:ChaB family protein [Patescibacteria group bacterium]|nr:ChaB family protein [Patescibacteria group bacterium]MBU1008373.1 ChaB family protein [Candidatus Dependentiae bacterium]
MPYTESKPPAMWANLPKELIKVLVKTFNAAYETVGDVQAIFAAWANAKKTWKRVSGEWVKKTTGDVKTSITVNIEGKKIGFIKLNDEVDLKLTGEDEYFWYLDKTLTTVGVMNGAFKPPEEIRAIPDNLPERFHEVLPVFNNHPDENNGEGDLTLSDGFIFNIRNEEITFNGQTKPRTRGTEAIPKTQPEAFDAAKMGMGNSIGFYADTEESAGEYEGRKYFWIERNITLVHDARIVIGEPACGPDQGCGYNSEEGLKTKSCGCPQNKGDDIMGAVDSEVNHSAGKSLQVKKHIEYIEITGDTMKNEEQEVVEETDEEEVEEEESEESEAELPETEPVEESPEPEDEPEDTLPASDCEHIAIIAERDAEIKRLKPDAEAWRNLKAEERRAKINEALKLNEKLIKNSVESMTDDQLDTLLLALNSQTTVSMVALDEATPKINVKNSGLPDEVYHPE